MLVGCDDDVGKEGSCGVVLDRLDNQACKTRASTSSLIFFIKLILTLKDI